MSLRGVVEELSVHGKKVLLALGELGEKSELMMLARRTGLDQSAIMRAALSLEERGLIKIREEEQTIVSLTGEGSSYAKEGLPERRALTALAQAEATVEEVAKRASLERNQIQIALAWLHRKGWAEFTHKAGRNVLILTGDGSTALSKKFSDEKLLEFLASRDRSLDEVPKNLKPELEILVKRGLAITKKKVRRTLELTESGKEALALGIQVVEEVRELTKELLLSGRWREARFRRYDVRVPGAPVYPSKIHPQQQVIDELREILLEMGFLEIKSRIVESEFWNFDALFQAQDHPAREIHDSLSVAIPAKTKPPPLPLLKRVIRAHERGIAGSCGWGYKFNSEISQRPVLCSQTTAATVRYLASRPKPPVKVFCIDRVYRHEHVDYKHLAEFYQCEGIVMERGLTLRDMLGYLKLIVNKLGLEKIRFRPGYFPYTEPSVEADVYFPEKGEWLEILGAGMFRPELLRPLGIRDPVLAWGIGFSRLAMVKLGIDDIRNLYCNDLAWLKERGLV